MRHTHEGKRTMTTETETQVVNVVSVSIPAWVAKAIPKAIRYGYRHEDGECELTDFDRSIVWSDVSADGKFSGSIDRKGIDLAKLGEPCEARESVHYWMPECEPEVSLSVPAMVAESVLECCDEDNGRFALGGVAVTKGGTLVATDGRRLIVVGGESEPDVVAIIPAESLRMACKLAKKHGTVSIYASKDRADITARTKGGESFDIVSRVIDGRFPRWIDVIPAKNTTYSGSVVHLPAKAERDRIVKLQKIRDKESSPKWGVGPAIVDLRFLDFVPMESDWSTNGPDGTVAFRWRANNLDFTYVVQPLARSQEDDAKQVAAWESIVKNGRECYESIVETMEG